MRAGPEDIAQAVARLASGRLVAFPTETVYGLGADAFDAVAVARVFDRKGRPAENPLIVHVSDATMARTVVADWPDRATALARAFWPGPLTMVLWKDQAIPSIVTAGGDTVGVRCPDHPLTLALIEAYGRPIVGPSANPSGAVSPTTAAHVSDAWPEDGELGVFVIDGGPCRAGIESTVVDLTTDVPMVLRPGVIGVDAIATALGTSVRNADAVGSVTSSFSSPPATATGLVAGGSVHHSATPPHPVAARSPGRIGAHYQPSVPLRLYSTMDELGALLAGASGPVVVLSPPGVPVAVDPPHVSYPMSERAAGYAAELYARLREADAEHPVLILASRIDPSVGVTPGEEAIWNAVAERLQRASWM